MMLNRLQSDCEYFLGFGAASERVLWAQNVHGQIREMKRIYAELTIKPRWLTEKKIRWYHRKMISRLRRNSK
jgi:hypothetical protein